MYYIQNFRREFEVSTSWKEDKRKKPKKIGFNSSCQKEDKRKKEVEKKVGFYYIDLYFREIVSLRKRLNDFSQLRQLHKSQIPLIALTRGMSKFVKELVILFHRIPAAPWNHVMSTIKEGHLKNLPLFFQLLPLLATGPNCNSPSTANVFGILTTTCEPRATNALTELKGTRITAKFPQAFYPQNLT